MKIGLVSLGCPRNLVDSEIIVGSLKSRGHRIVDIEKADAAIVNTCSFIESARAESVDVILQAERLKAEGKVKFLIVAGCLAQRHYRDMTGELKSVDAFVGTSDFHRMPEIIESLSRRGRTFSTVSKKLEYLADEKSPRSLLTPRHYAYLKISEGCDNRCSYCVISSLRGPFRSRHIESIVKEARSLQRLGAKELNIIGQDTTMYGVDIYGRPRLAELLRKLSSLKSGRRWTRLLYTHPAHYQNALIDIIAEGGSICKYLDLPIQHASDRMLKAMNRGVTRSDITKLIDRLRTRIKDIAIRTSIIVGFPGETDRDFEELLKFLRDVKFERLGAFMYSREEGTKAYGLGNQIEEKLKKERLDEVMKLQQAISEETNKRFLGRELEVLIDEPSEEEAGVFLGRTQYDAPEVDGIVYVKGKGLKPGDFKQVRIVDTLEYDFVGELV